MQTDRELLELAAKINVDFERWPYASAADLLSAHQRGTRFILNYHGSKVEVTTMRAREGDVYVTDGKMLPVQIYPNGTSKDGKNIWLSVAEEPT